LCCCTVRTLASVARTCSNSFTRLARARLACLARGSLRCDRAPSSCSAALLCARFAALFELAARLLRANTPESPQRASHCWLMAEQTRGGQELREQQGYEARGCPDASPHVTFAKGNLLGCGLNREVRGPRGSGRSGSSPLPCLALLRPASACWTRPVRRPSPGPGCAATLLIILLLTPPLQIALLSSCSLQRRLARRLARAKPQAEPDDTQKTLYVLMRCRGTPPHNLVLLSACCSLRRSRLRSRPTAHCPPPTGCTSAFS